jgi:DNA repair protein RadC
MDSVQVREAKISYSGERVYNGQIYGPSTMARFFEPLQNAIQEEFWVVGMTARHSPVFAAQVSRGTLSSSIVHPREVFRLAFHPDHTCNSIVVAHNHPTGDATASKEDTSLTHRLQVAGRLLGIPLIDHLIIGDPEFYSYKDEEEFWLSNDQIASRLRNNELE